MHIEPRRRNLIAVILSAAASYDLPEFRERHAADQRRLINQMCEETGYSMSRLAKVAGVHNSTITRYTRKGLPNKWDTFIKMVQAYIQVIRGLGREPAPNVLRYVQSVGLGDVDVGGMVGEGEALHVTARITRVALTIANEEMKLNLSDEDVSDLANYVQVLYPIIVSAEKKAGKPIDPNDEATRILINRERARRNSSSSGEC